MDIPCISPTFIFVDNQSVLANTTVPDSTLKKKSHIIAYHFVQKVADYNELRTAYVNTYLNPSDIPTKTLPSGEKWTNFVHMILHYIFGLFVFGWFYFYFGSGIGVSWSHHLIYAEGFNLEFPPYAPIWLLTWVLITNCSATVLFWSSSTT